MNPPASISDRDARQRAIEKSLVWRAKFLCEKDLVQFQEELEGIFDRALAHRDKQIEGLVEAAREALDKCHTGSLMIHSCVSGHHDYVHVNFEKTERYAIQKRLFEALSQFESARK